MITKIKQSLHETTDSYRTLTDNDQLIQHLQLAVEMITNAFRSGSPVFFCGNGESTANAQHLATELFPRAQYDY